MKFKKIIFLIIVFIFSLFFSGCEYLGGIASIEVREDINHSLIEDFLVKNTSLEEQNITIASTIITTLQNLKNLDKELNSLNEQISNISENLDKIKNDSNLDAQTVKNLEYLDELVYRSQTFVNSLEESSNYWFGYLNSSKNNVNNLNFSYNEDENSEIIDSVSKPLEAFEEE